MRSVQEIAAAVRRVDWDFASALTNYGLHRLHWYPGTFIPQIPAYLIELLSDADDVVYDPFCGAGTTLIEAIRLGRRAIGTDINPIAIQIARAKAMFMRPGTLQRLCEAVTTRILERAEERGLHAKLALFQQRSNMYLSGSAVDDRLRLWYHRQTFHEMKLIKEVIDEAPARIRGFLNVVFSSIVKRTSSQRRHWGYVADNVIPKEVIYVDAIGAFCRAVLDAQRGSKELLSAPALAGVSIQELRRRIEVNAVDLLKGEAIAEGSVDLIVTSPPYPHTTDYSRAQRLSLWWFNDEPERLREAEIGARFKRHRGDAVADYFDEMRAAIRALSPALKRDRYLCMVVGDAPAKGFDGGVVEELRRVVVEQGYLEPVPMVRRTLSRQRLRRRTGEATAEVILFFRKR